MSTVYLPAWIEPKANRFAEDYVEEALGIKPGSKKYQNAYEKAKYTFCKDYYESQTGIKANPTAVKAYQTFDVFADVLFRSGNGFVNQYVKNEDQARLLTSRLKGDIVHLAHIWLENAAKIAIKKIDKLFSGMVYAQRTGSRDVDENSMREVNIRRLKRAFMLSALISAIKSCYDTEPEALDKMIREAVKDIPTNHLNSEYVYANLSEALKKPLLDAYKTVNVTQIGENALRGANIKPSQEQAKKMEKEK